MNQLKKEQFNGWWSNFQCIMWFESQYSVHSNDPSPQLIVWRMDYSHWIVLNIDYWIAWCTKSETISWIFLSCPLRYKLYQRLLEKTTDRQMLCHKMEHISDVLVIWIVIQSAWTIDRSPKTGSSFRLFKIDVFATNLSVCQPVFDQISSRRL